MHSIHVISPDQRMPKPNDRPAHDHEPMACGRRDFLATAAAAVAPLMLPGSTWIWPSPRQRSFDPWLEIDVAALARNAQTIARMAGGKPVIAVVKNNAYGHGLATVGPHLDTIAAIHMLAVVRPGEALELRRAGVKK